MVWVALLLVQSAVTPQIDRGRALFFDARDYYGANYLIDLALGHWWSGALAVGKHCYLDGERKQIVNDGTEYRFVRGLGWRHSLVAVSAVPELTFGKLLEESEMEVALPVCLALDRFNYCRNSQNSSPPIEDLRIENKGIPFTDLKPGP
jgi:hypothetical protein